MRTFLPGAILCALSMPPCSAAPPDALPSLPKPQADYLLNCGGCHGLNGVSNGRLVPDLRSQVGYFLRLHAGREYLVRLPSVAFSAMSDEEVAAVLNFIVFQIGGSGVPGDAARYSAAEVAALRRRPLNEVSLTEYRSRLVETLIFRFGAPAGLRSYGNGH
jgi:hypothetical protein